MFQRRFSGSAGGSSISGKSSSRGFRSDRTSAKAGGRSTGSIQAAIFPVHDDLVRRHLELARDANRLIAAVTKEAHMARG